MINKQDIKEFLSKIGVKSNGTVLVHSSIRSIGGIEGGIDALIDAFTEYLTDGLFIVPTHTWDNVGKDCPVFDVNNTVPCIGALPMVAAGRKDGVRSLHPTHSVAVFGKRAHEFVCGEQNATTPAPIGGCWSRLYEEDATVLLIGVEQNRNTFLHAVDEVLDLPGKLVEPIMLTVIGDDKRYQINFRKHGNTGSENFTNFTEPFIKLGAVRLERLGNATVQCCSARKCAEVVKHLWSKASYDLTAERREIPVEYYSDITPQIIESRARKGDFAAKYSDKQE